MFPYLDYNNQQSYNGVTVRKEYIEKLRELGIEEVYIRDKEASAHEIVILRTELDESVHTFTIRHSKGISPVRSGNPEAFIRS